MENMMKKIIELRGDLAWGHTICGKVATCVWHATGATAL